MLTSVPPLIDPAHDFISSERYLESLEKKLKKVTGKSKTEPTSKDIIRSLEQCKEASMKHLLESSENTDQTVDYTGAVLNKSHQGQQQTTEEIVALVFQDQLAVHQTEVECKCTSELKCAEHLK
ncbi:coiled-coil domain-containing protein 32-like [Saccostrea echinata]|uniref:coiled-coil domain-containing protein 32-like n=1 Tax=Saccostrea echinata TaxID=191078 RepID=UPI002A8010DF|nr:coiled-coil domain-containing protein 32-like [Saccostrea echinata]